jgi:acetyl-CoA carboxylase carboxyltransferase component
VQRHWNDCRAKRPETIEACGERFRRYGVVVPTPSFTIGLRSRTPGATTGGVTELDGRSVALFRIDGTDRRGALSSAAAETIQRTAQVALAEGLPLIGLIESSGSDIAEGVAALHGWGAAAKAIAACSGRVPVLFAAIGPAVSGPALLLGLADHVVFTDSSYAFVSGPTMVAEFTGIEIDNTELGGAASHARFSGTASLVVTDEDAALEAIGRILAYVPSTCDAEPPRWPTDDDPARATPEAGDLMPAVSTGSYDVRKVIESLVDDGDYLEVRARWARNIVTCFATVDGRPVGVVANQPMNLAGTLDIPASQKAARFVAFCDAFNLPIITLVDTPGFYPGKDLEWRGMIRHGAQLVFAYGRATVPRICVILRKSYGGAYIVMDSKRMGNDLCLAWPGAELAVMGAGQAAAILMRKATTDERAEFEADYAERLLNPYVAAERGYVDAVIEPTETRAWMSSALEMLSTKREKLPRRKHDNTPL